MTTEALTPEETTALEAMESDTEMTEAEQEAGNAEVEAKAQETEAAQTEAAQEAPEEKVEFKSTRAEEQRPPEGFVPHQAMHAERTKRQALEVRLAELEKSIQAPADAPPAYVDPLEDPKGFQKWAEHNQEATAKSLEAERAQRESTARAVQRQDQATQFEAQFTKAVPDYQVAAQFLHQSRISQLRGQGYGDAEIGQQLAFDANAIFDAGEKTGINPAQLIYLRAQEAGYTKAAPEPATGEADKLEATAAAQQATRGLNTAGGAAQRGQITAAQIAEMSEDEIGKLSEDDLRIAMGG